ncbi:MAG: hypothetical protein AAB177_01445 [Nitrospirota bacterium]
MTLSDSSNEALSALSSTITILTWGGLSGSISVAPVLGCRLVRRVKRWAYCPCGSGLLNPHAEAHAQSGAGSWREQAALIVMGPRGWASLPSFSCNRC